MFITLYAARCVQILRVHCCCIHSAVHAFIIQSLICAAQQFGEGVANNYQV